DERYWEAAQVFADQWLAYLATEPTNDRLWSDHAVALRSSTLGMYLTILEFKGLPIPPDALENAQLCVDNIVDEATYRTNHSHGIIQLRGLAALAKTFHHEHTLIPLIVERLHAQLDRVYNRAGVHVENTPSYQVGADRVFAEFADHILPALSDEIDVSWVRAKLAQSQGFLDAVALSPSFYPQVGEMFTEFPPAGDWEPMRSFYPAPPGYYIAKDPQTYKLFKAGCADRTRKHFDDLALWLFSRGVDILIDPGMFSYEREDPIRNYCVSAQGHNTVTVDTQILGRQALQAGRTGFLSYVEKPGYTVVSAFNDMYERVAIMRTLYDFGDLMIVVDDCHSDEEHTYNQSWHLNENAIRIAAGTEVVYAIPGSSSILRIKQFLPVVIQETRRGLNKAMNTHDIAQVSGWVCRGLGEPIPTDTVIFRQFGRQARFLTAISIEDDDQISLADGTSVTSEQLVMSPSTGWLELAGAAIVAPH
ncbi:MAG: heparinase II/III-family protein, partial [Propionibacteriaceae bacterium]|nr:heparinase II/III-family protein [Propionibacteriaceae bacterium]